MKHFTILFICFLGLSAKVFGQEVEAVELWGDFNYDRYITTSFSIVADAGIRADVSHGDSWRLYINPGAAYRLNEIFSFRANVGLFQTWNKSSPNSTELRIAQEANAQWPQYAKFRFKNRFKVEERFTSYSNLDDNSTTVPNTNSYRFRYRLIGQTDYFNLSKRIVNFYTLGLAEVFIPVSKSEVGNNPRRIRLGVGFGQLLPKGRHYEINMLWQGSYDKNISDAHGEKWVIRFRYYLKTQPVNTN